MSIGLFVFGKRCIDTMGTNITKVHPSSGFTTSIIAVCVVQVCSVFGLPVSSTHCQVGAVIGIFWVCYRKFLIKIMIIFFPRLSFCKTPPFYWSFKRHQKCQMEIDEKRCPRLDPNITCHWINQLRFG